MTPPAHKTPIFPLIGAVFALLPALCGAQWPERQYPFIIGEIVADPLRNFVYMTDQTHDRLLRMDTVTGHFDRMALAASAANGGRDGIPNVSRDGSELFVPLPASGQIQIVDLSQFETTAIISTGIFPQHVVDGIGGDLYVGSRSSVYRLQRATGATQRVVGVSDDPSRSQYLEINADGTLLYFANMGLSGGSDAFEIYSLSAAGNPQRIFINGAPFLGGMHQLLLDEPNGGLFMAQQAESALQRYDFIGESTAEWPMNDPFTIAVADTPSAGHVFAATSVRGTIRKFNKVTGTVLASYDMEAHTADHDYAGDTNVAPRGLATTPNGALIYKSTFFNSMGWRYFLGSIGGPPLQEVLPGANPLNLENLVQIDSAGRYGVPNSASDYQQNDGAHFYDLDFDANGWAMGTASLGYERASENTYAGEFQVDTESAMYDRQQSVYLRIPFSSPTAGFSVQRLRLWMQYDDGFIAYLNGQQIAARNAPAIPAWNSGATTTHDDDQALLWEEIDLTTQGHLLQTGFNLLAIHGLNRGTTSSDFLLNARLDVAYQPFSYDAWITSFNLNGTAAESDADPDGDALSNLYEFGTGGDPTSGDSTTLLPSLAKNGSSIEVRYPRRSDWNNLGISYQLEFCEDLTTSDWQPAGSATYPVTESIENASAAHETVVTTLENPASENLWVRLKVSL